MNICFDMDDVISNTYPEMFRASLDFNRKVLKRKVNEDLDISMAKGDYYWFARALDWSEEDLRIFFHTYYPSFLKTSKVIKDSVDFINNIDNTKHHVTILSARETRSYENVEQITIEWLDKYSVKYDKVLIGHKIKYEYLKENKIDLFVDDNIENCKQAIKAGVPRVFVYKTVYNMHKENENIDTLTSLLDITKHVDLT